MPTPIRCDIAHRQGVKYPDCPTRFRMCDKTHMPDFDMAAFRRRLQQLMDEREIKRKPLAQQAGLGETAIRDIFNPERHDVRVGTLCTLAGFFDVRSEESRVGEGWGSQVRSR